MNRWRRAFAAVRSSWTKRLTTPRKRWRDSTTLMNTGVVHRDVKPDNMIITPEGVLKIIDFGMAKTQAAARLTASGAPLGSPIYMSPEQVRGGEQADRRTDVYSMGVVLYELATGRRPFVRRKPVRIHDGPRRPIATASN